MSSDQPHPFYEIDMVIATFVRAGATKKGDDRTDDLGETADKVEAYWNSLDAVADDPRILSLRARARHQLTGQDDQPVAGHRRFNIRSMLGLVASLLLAVSLFSYLGQINRPGAVHGEVVVLANGKGAPRSFNLQDGTKVVVDASSSVRVLPWGASRMVQLIQGRAFFDVAHNSRQPFIVKVGSNDVTALGTAFSVERLPQSTAVILMEGRVRVRGEGNGEGVVLSPDQSVTITEHGNWMVRPVDSHAAESWRDGVIVFDNQPAYEIVEKLNKYLAFPIVITNEADKKANISGAFQVSDYAGVVAALDTMGIETRVDANQYH